MENPAAFEVWRFVDGYRAVAVWKNEAGGMLWHPYLTLCNHPHETPEQAALCPDAQKAKAEWEATKQPTEP